MDVWGEPPSSTSGWTTSVGSSYTSTCNGQTIIGGHLVFGKNDYATKTFSGLPGHNTVTIQWDAYLIDSWDAGDGYIVKVDETGIYSRIYLMGSNSSTNYCGVSGWSDYIYTQSKTISHNSTTLKLDFIVEVDELADNEAFGFKNVKITVDVICTPACATCFGNDITECYSCNSGWFLNGNTCMNPCPASMWGDSVSRLCKRKFNYYFKFVLFKVFISLISL